MNSEVLDFLTVAQLAARAAGSVIRTNFSNPGVVQSKAVSDFTVAADRLAEEAALSVISTHFPDHSIVSEESGELSKSNTHRWIVDPLDGTNNFACGIPHCGTSIALLVNGTPALGVVYQPFLDDLYCGVLGEGAWRNGVPLRCESTRSPKEGTVSFIRGHEQQLCSELIEEAERLEAYLRKSSRRLLSLWAPSLDWVLAACGKIDLLVSFESEVEDQYAGALIAYEAGATLYSLQALEPVSASAMLMSRRLVCGGSNAVRSALSFLEQFQSHS